MTVPQSDDMSPSDAHVTRWEVRFRERMQLFLRQLRQIYARPAQPMADPPAPTGAPLEEGQSHAVVPSEQQMSPQSSRREVRQRVEFAGWPGESDPRDAHVYAHNEFHTPAKPEQVWAWLDRARQWPHWYPNSWHVRILKVKTKIPNTKTKLTLRELLESDTKFKWITFGLPIIATVHTYRKPSTLGWEWHSRGWRGNANGYHVWLIEAQPDGCRIVTEETQRGMMPRLFRFGLQPALHVSHQMWLRRLSKNAISGPPPVKPPAVTRAGE